MSQWLLTLHFSLVSSSSKDSARFVYPDVTELDLVALLRLGTPAKQLVGARLKV